MECQEETWGCSWETSELQVGDTPYTENGRPRGKGMTKYSKRVCGKEVLTCITVTGFHNRSKHGPNVIYCMVYWLIRII